MAILEDGSEVSDIDLSYALTALHHTKRLNKEQCSEIFNAIGGKSLTQETLKNAISKVTGKSFETARYEDVIKALNEINI